MSASVIASIRFQSVSDFLEVSFFFIPRRLSDGDYTDNFVGFRMDDHDYACVQYSKGDDANLAVVKALVQETVGRAGENLFAIKKIETVIP